MAYPNKTIFNPKVRQGIRFIQTSKETGGKLLEMEATYEPHSKEPAPHYHPYQAEEFRVLSGELAVKMDGKLTVLKAGDTLHIPVKQVHAMWNNSNEQARVNWKVQPAMETEYLMETLTGLAIDGKTNQDGMPNLLQIALTVNRFSNVIRLTKPPFIVQRILFLLLTPFAYLLGYRPMYPKHLD